MTIVHRSQIRRQTTANLISAGVINQEEAEVYDELMSGMTWNELLTALLESHQMLEDCLKPVNYYPIGEISQN